MEAFAKLKALVGHGAKTEVIKDGSGNDRRRAMRRPQRMANAFLWCERLIRPRACVIKDFSQTGAKVLVLDDDLRVHLLEHGVILYFCAEKQEVLCRVAWNRGQMIGLSFTGRMRDPSRKYPS